MRCYKESLFTRGNWVHSDINLKYLVDCFDTFLRLLLPPTVVVPSLLLSVRYKQRKLIFFILGHISNQLGINLVTTDSVRLLAGLYPVISVLYTVTVLQLTATVLKYPCYSATIIRYSSYCNLLHHSARLESLGFSSFLWRFPRHECWLIVVSSVFQLTVPPWPLYRLKALNWQKARYV